MFGGVLCFPSCNLLFWMDFFFSLGTSHRHMEIFSHRKAKQRCSVLFSGLVKMSPGSDKTATTAASSLISLTPARLWVTSFLAFVTAQSALVGSWIPRLAKKRFRLALFEISKWDEDLKSQRFSCTASLQIDPVSIVESTQKFITPPEYWSYYFLSLNGCQGNAFAEHSDFIKRVSFDLLDTNRYEC